jgi:hypothetical protein
MAEQRQRLRVIPVVAHRRFRQRERLPAQMDHAALRSGIPS